MEIRIGSTVLYEGGMYVVYNIEDKCGYAMCSHTRTYSLLPLKFVEECSSDYIQDVNMHRAIEYVEVKGSLMPLTLVEDSLYNFIKPDVTVILKNPKMHPDYEFKETLMGNEKKRYK